MPLSMGEDFDDRAPTPRHGRECGRNLGHVHHVDLPTIFLGLRHILALLAFFDVWITQGSAGT